MNGSVKISGAGVSGLTAAINLAKHGYDVVVYEKRKSFANENICAVRNYDLPMDAVEEFKKCGVELRPCAKVKKVIKSSPNHSMEEHSRGKAIFYLLERGSSENSIENQLLKQAKELGVKIVTGKPVKEREVDIVATGSRRTDILAYGHMYEGLNTDEDTAYIIYDNLYAPGGYIYILTSGDRTVIISVSFDKKKFRYLPVNFSLFLRKNELVKTLVGEKEPLGRVSGYGNYDILRTAKRNGRYLVGERGFFMDASKGFGIRYAVLTGYLAAKAIVENLDYDELWRDILLEELRRNFKRRIMLNKFTNKDYDMMLCKMGKRIDIENYLKESRKMRKHIDLFFPLYMLRWKMKNFI